MKWTDDRSDNFDDRRGSGGGGGMLVGGGLGTIIIAAIVFFLGGDPSAILNSNASGSQQTEQRQLSQEELKIGEFVNMLQALNEETWAKIFNDNSIKFRPAKVVLFESGTQSGCGAARSEMGPFYCPNDETIYMDMSFFSELQSKFGAKVGQFTVAYVLGHEYGHHIQNLLGTLGKIDQLRQSGRYSESEMNRVSVANELQADFYAGVWAKQTDSREKILEPGDIQEAMSAAAAVGDDNIQKRAQGYVNQESFTHGSSAQREEWFMKGYTTGDIRQGDTFDALLK
ncbi:KPN_02809 family neutral zinc metallopeptidase [Epilithonimonas vandammei]|mgnify:FL=1|jgi:predicted metalloprotease|uniref:Metalloprotease n=1 Tax=Epilithonimonas vandammei TaxID=2487072 RepID=A0A3G8ZJV2_9FLAO|nr:neutral zinc metallopeptidase [Epilithonimonas vandammei]AZI54171.1 metalloprotease [Epilithonimonas vandammei]